MSSEGQAAAQEGYSEQQQSGYQQEPDQSQIADALSAIYSQVQQLSSDYNLTKGQLASLLEENSRVAKARNPNADEMPPIEDYDKALHSITKSHQETRDALAGLAALLQDYFNNASNQQKEQQERAEQEQLAATYQYVQQAAQQVDGQLESEGYPGFMQYKSLVKEAIFNAPGWSSDPNLLEQQIALVNEPMFWAYVYKEHVFPTIERYSNIARHSSPVREAMAQSEGGDNWSTEDYLAMRGQHNQIITR